MMEEASKQLAGAAVLGLARTGGVPDLAVSPRVREAVGPHEGAARLLALAASLSQLQAGGVRAQEAPPEAMPRDAGDAPDETSTALASLLARVAADHPVLIPESCRLLANAGRTIPHTLLHVFLEHAARGVAVEPDVLGARGGWLAALNPRWSAAAAKEPATPADARDRWTSSTSNERLALLIAVRRSAPALGRELVGSTWSEDALEDRKRFIEAFRIGLSLEDEPTLERALDEKQALRSIAAGLLASLPGSGLSQRMRSRLVDMVTLDRTTRGLVRKKEAISIVADPPEGADKQGRRDGIDGRAIPGLGKRAALLRKVVGLARLDALPTTYDLDPSQLIEAAKASDWWVAFRDGWAEAISRQSNGAWAASLMTALSQDELQAVASGTDFGKMMAALRQDEALLIAVMRSSTVSLDVLGRMVVELEGPWSAEVSAVVTRSMQKLLPKTDVDRLRYPGPERTLLETVAARIHPDEFESIRRRLDRPEAEGRAAEVLAQCLATIDIRTELYEETSRV